MALINWDESLSVKIKEIDDQHRKLIELINNLNDAMAIGKGKDVMDDILANLSKYTVIHFNTEEKYMDQYEYPFSFTHKKEHKDFIQKVSDFQKSFQEGKITISVDVMNFLRDWLVKHIKGTDQKYSSFFNEKGLK